MLTARRVPRACHSCRLQLLSLFEHGFTKSMAGVTIHARRIAFQKPQPRQLVTRNFSTTITSRHEPISDAVNPNTTPPDNVESIVRQARQTFGETLPKDYLTTEEYILYERLYGPPLRDTKAEDLEYVPDGEEPEAVPTRNVLLLSLIHI